MAASVVAILIALTFILIQLLKGRASAAVSIAKVFYSDDDGKTWFIDDRSRLAPFDHNGKQAVRAEVFRCGAGRPFVGYLERYSDAAKARITAAFAANKPAADMIDEPMEVKRPAEIIWVQGDITKPVAYKEYLRIITPVCPGGGSEGLVPVSPIDSDNGATK